MQKKLIALAVAGLASTAAFAQTNVTIYGVVDAGYAYSSGDNVGTVNKNANFSGIQSGILAGSRIGFKGEEALGNGLKAIFTLEYGIANDVDGGVGTGTGALGTRQSFIGLSHAKLGTVALGRQYGPGYMATTRNDALASSVPSALTQMNTAGVNTIQGGSNARLNNSIAYVTPNWSGFTATAAYAFGESAPSAVAAGNGISSGNNGVFGLGLNYANGPLNLDFVYHSRQGVSAAQFAGVAAAGGVPASAAHVATQDSINEWFIGGSYDFKVVKVMATYQDQNDNNGTSATEIGNKVWSVGAVVPVFGNGKIHASYSDLSWDRRSAGDSDAWTLAYTHALSKRTTLYTGYTRASNDKDAVNAAGAVAATRALGENNATFVAGINHSF
jgi:predicted porin